MEHLTRGKRGHLSRHNSGIKQLNAESLLWLKIRNKLLGGYSFTRNVIIDLFIVDFVCKKQKLIIEIEKGYPDDPEKIRYDRKRTVYLMMKGYTVLRVLDTDILNNLDGVLKNIAAHF